jgi:hypothetical protein
MIQKDGPLLFVVVAINDKNPDEDLFDHEIE